MFWKLSFARSQRGIAGHKRNIAHARESHSDDSHPRKWQ